MRTLVLYQSQNGSTAKYAKDLAERVGAEVFPLKKFKLKKAPEYDTIVFFGWVMGGNIQGLNNFLTVWDDISEKNVIVVGVGMSIPTPEGRRTLIEQNVLDIYHIRFYQMQGSFDMQKLKFPYSFLMKNTLRQIENDPESTQKAVLTIRDHPLEVYDHAKMDRLVEVINGLSIQEVHFEEKA